ncbi:MAG: YafY family transcriptional regulator [Phycisphaerae bacterium]|nr:YafY family transcriptional regulator [Phycisphaerae bacterium]
MDGLMNVSRVYRLLKLITLLRSGRRYDVESLAEELGVSRRTLFRDLKMLELAGVPYRFEHGKHAYAIRESFFLPPLHLNLQESLALLLVTRKFLARQVHPMYQQALDAALKIESNLPAAVLKHCGEWLDGVSIRWPPTSPADVVTNLFQTVQRALANHTRLKVRYDSVYDGKEIEVLLEPLRLVFMARGWYLIANSRTHNEVRTFKMDRMIEVVDRGDEFTPDADFSEKRYFGAAWRMIPDGTVYSVLLRFSAVVATSVEEVLWHESQSTTRLDDGRLLFEAEVDGLREICSWVLAYGDQVEVLAPKELRDMIREKAARMIALAEAVEH